VDLAAKRIAYVKYLNAGQICLSVNHVFVEESVHDEFVKRLGYWFDKYMVEPSDFTRIINSRNFDRLENILKNTDGKIAYGGKTDRDDRFIHPTVVTGVTLKGKKFKKAGRLF
jgi:aldehyde dehydrogenase (NAD+)